MHESGHAMYEQGLRYEAFGTPCGSSVSLGIHESQSRMWENQVGRSESFWRFATPMLERHFGAAVAGIDARVRALAGVPAAPPRPDPTERPGDECRLADVQDLLR